jgi:Raf kinase inhibitor-like YbhB/YbcL family protein
MKTLLSLFTLLLSAIVQAQISPESIMQLSSPDFANGGPIPKRFTCDDVNHSPGLRISGVPKAAKSLVLIMDDPDAPGGTFNHWLLWNLSPDLKEISTNSVPNGAVQGLNDFKKNAYGGPCPPAGEHRYYFRLYAADIPVNLPQTAKRADLDKVLRGHILKDATLMGRYARPGSRRD